MFGSDSDGSKGSGDSELDDNGSQAQDSDDDNVEPPKKHLAKSYQK